MKFNEENSPLQFSLVMEIDGEFINAAQIGTTEEILKMFAIFIIKTAEDEQKDPDELTEELCRNLTNLKQMCQKELAS